MMKKNKLLKTFLLLTAMLVGSATNVLGQTTTWDFTDCTAQSFDNGKSYSFLASDGTEMRYSAGSSDAIVAKTSKKDGYLKENGATGDNSDVVDIDGKTSIGKTRLIRLFVTGSGKLTINCNGTNGTYKVLDGATDGTTLISSLSANTQSDVISVSNFLWIETTTKGYINTIVWTPSASDSRTDLIGEWTANNLVFEKGSTATIPSFSVTGGIMGTDYSVAYSLVTDGGNVTVNATTGITDIDTETVGTSVVKATITVINTTDFKASTSEYECTIKVTEPAPEATKWNFNVAGTKDENYLNADGGTLWTYDSSNNRYSNANTGENLTLTAGGNALKSAEGLTFNFIKADDFRYDIKNKRSWVAGATITIPNLTQGQVVTVKMASSKADVSRGFDLTNLSESSWMMTSTTGEEQTATVLEDGDVTMTATGGVYLYYINVTDVTVDTEAPTLSSSTPENGATNVAVSGTVVLTFNENIATVDATKFSMTGATMGTVEIDGTDSKKVNVAYSGAENEATVTLSVDAEAVADAAGNASAALSDISFTTKPEAATLTAVSDYMWTFDGDNWENSYAQNSEEVVANNLGILASNTAIAIDGNKKSMDGYSFTKRLKLGGTGSATTQNVHFKVAGACKITVYGMSSNANNTRPLGITANDVEEATDFPGDRIYKAVYYYTGTTATDVYVYSKNSGINIYGIKVEPITDASVTISSAKFASFSDGVARDFSATGITVYTAKATGTSVQLTEVTDGIVPANTGVVLYSKSEVTKAVPMVTTTKTTLEDNEMVANVSGAKVAKAGEDGKTNYILSNEDAGVGFYLAVEGGAYLPANRAYLSTTTTATGTGNAPFLGFDGNETTGINSVERGALSVEGCYTLDGRRVAQPTKGLYIVNGRKVLVK